MKRFRNLLAVVSFIGLLSTSLVSAQERDLLADVVARKSVMEVTDSGWILTRLEITNNSSVPVFRIEIYEYYNPSFVLGDNFTVKYGDKDVIRGIPSASGGQFIIQINDPEQLEAGESLEIRYWSRSLASGDFQVPTSVVWYSFDYEGNLIRTNVFSNGLLVHVKGELERTVDQALPYVISGVAFVITLIVLDYMRRNLRGTVKKVKEKRLFR
ncbi:MAG: hypothetical protein ACE5KU_01900 [Nitrososphaerales archaeon]